MNKQKITCALIKKLQKLVPEFKKHGVEKMILFGSYARNQPRLLFEVNWAEDYGPSDIDLFVVFESFSSERRENLRSLLSQHFKKEIDIAVPDHIRLELVDLVNLGVSTDGINIL